MNTTRGQYAGVHGNGGGNSGPQAGGASVGNGPGRHSSWELDQVRNVTIYDLP